MVILLRGATLGDGSATDVCLSGTNIETVAPVGSVNSEALEEVIDLEGYVLLPAMVDAHTHLDKANSADLVSNSSGDLMGAIDAWSKFRRTLTEDDIYLRASEMAEAALAFGVTAIRTHADVGPGVEMKAVRALVRLRDDYRDLIDIQVCALAYPLTGKLDSANRERLREALRIGVDVVGGAPELDPEPHEHMAICLALAAEFDCPVDLHLDENLHPASMLAEFATQRREHLNQPVAASHCVSLGMCPENTQIETSNAVASAGIDIITMPQSNLYLQGRGILSAKPRGITSLDTLKRAGVTLAGGSDNNGDPFNPVGCGDPMRTARLLVIAGHLTVDEAYEMVSRGGRAVMRLPEVRVAPGYPADLVAIRAASLRAAMASGTEDRLVFRRGRLVRRTAVDRTAYAPASVV